MPNLSDISLVYNDKPLTDYKTSPLFQTVDGKNVWEGDTVSFKNDGDVFDTIGMVSNHLGLRIDSFNMVTGKWGFYPIEIIPDATGKDA